MILNLNEAECELLLLALGDLYYRGTEHESEALMNRIRSIAKGVSQDQEEALGSLKNLKKAFEDPPGEDPPTVNVTLSARHTPEQVRDDINAMLHPKGRMNEGGKRVIDSSWLLDYVASKTTQMVDVAKRKNADYAGASRHIDPFANFSRVEALGVATTEQGFLTRMTDKLCRITSLTQPGAEAQVKDESIHDTLLDLANYSILMSAYLTAKRLRAETL